MGTILRHAATAPIAHHVARPEHAVKLGVFLSNAKSRRAWLTADKLTVPAELGLDWAA